MFDISYGHSIVFCFVKVILFEWLQKYTIHRGFFFKRQCFRIFRQRWRFIFIISENRYLYYIIITVEEKQKIEKKLYKIYYTIKSSILN